MSIQHAYIGYVNMDRSEGRGPMMPAMVTLDVGVLDRRLPPVAGHFGMSGYLVEVDPAAPRLYRDVTSGYLVDPAAPPLHRDGVQILGTWVDEVGDTHHGLLPAATPTRWDAERVEVFKRLQRKFPDHTVSAATRALLHQTLPRPVTIRHGKHGLHLLFADGEARIGSSTNYFGQLRAIYSTLERATAGAQMLRTLEPDVGRLHVAAVAVEPAIYSDRDAATTFDLTDEYLGHTPNPPAWATHPSPLNTDTQIVWSETAPEPVTTDPDLVAYEAMLAALATSGPTIAPVGTTVSSSRAIADYVLAHGTQWDKVDGDWTVVPMPAGRRP